MAAQPHDQGADAATVQSWPPAPWQPEGTVPDSFGTNPLPEPDPLTALPWNDGAATRPEEASPRPWEPSPWTPSTPDAPENHTLVQEGNPWEPTPGLPWQPGTLGTEQMPAAEQAWRYDPGIPLGPAPDVPAAAGQGFVPPPADPWNRPPAHHAKKNRNTILLASACLIVVIAALTAVAIAFWPTGKTPARTADAPQPAGSQTPGGGSPGNPSASGGTPPASAPSGAAATQAGAVNGVLDSMAASRSEFAGAITDAQQCATLGNAIPVIQKVVGERQTELSSAQALQVDALPSGAQLKDALTRSLQASLDADNGYLNWANANQGCTGATPDTSDFDNANQISTDRATPAKQEFLQLWAPIAQQTNQPSRDADHI